MNGQQAHAGLQRSIAASSACCWIGFSTQLVEQITLSEPLVLPSAAYPRQGVGRKSPSIRDPNELAAFVQKAAQGGYSSVKPVDQVAKRLGVDVRELYRVAKVATTAAAEAMRARREADREKAKLDRQQGIREELERLGGDIAWRQQTSTRRLLYQEMEQRGWLIRWEERAACLAALKQSVSRWAGKGLGAGAADRAG